MRRRHAHLGRTIAVALGPLYTRTRLLESLGRYALRRPHEDEFYFFRRFRGSKGLFLDVGANSGISAISFRVCQRTAPILSVEANPVHQRDLAVIKRLLHDFDYRLCAAGSRAGRHTLYTPVYRGTPLTTLSTFDPLNLAPWRMRILFGEHFRPSQLRVAESSVEVVCLDDLGLAPGFVKIDVEGHELDVLRGLERTLLKHRPVVLLEWSREFHEVGGYLLSLGFRPFAYRPATNTLAPLTHDTRGLNVFCVHSRVESQHPDWFSF